MWSDSRRIARRVLIQNGQVPNWYSASPRVRRSTARCAAAERSMPLGIVTHSNRIITGARTMRTMRKNALTTGFIGLENL